MLSEVEYFQQKKYMVKDRKYLLLNKMLQRWPVVLAQLKAGKTSEHLLNKIRQIISSLYWTKEITKKSV